MKIFTDLLKKLLFPPGLHRANITQCVQGRISRHEVLRASRVLLAPKAQMPEDSDHGKKLLTLIVHKCWNEKDNNDLLEHGC